MRTDPRDPGPLLTIIKKHYYVVIKTLEDVIPW